MLNECFWWLQLHHTLIWTHTKAYVLGSIEHYCYKYDPKELQLSERTSAFERKWLRPPNKVKFSCSQLDSSPTYVHYTEMYIAFFPKKDSCSWFCGILCNTLGFYMMTFSYFSFSSICFQNEEMTDIYIYCKAFYSLWLWKTKSQNTSLFHETPLVNLCVFVTSVFFKQNRVLT